MNAISKENRNYFMGIAIILVILHHFCLRMEDAWHVDSFPFNLFYWGQIGVDIFLFVSAYGCCASWENNKWWQYLVNRVKRIYPQYVVFLLIVLCWFYADASVLHRLKFAAYSLIGVAPIYQLGVRIEWYIPSLIMMYWFLPVLCSVINKTRRCYGGGYLLVFVAILLPWLLKEPLIYYPFLARFPVIICGVMAYVHRGDIEYLIKFFTFATLLILTTRENMVIHSMMIPLLLTALSMVNLEKKPLERVLSFCGCHSLEIFFAQTITTQFMMQRYFWIDKWLSLLIIIGLTIVFSFLFGGVQRLFDVTYKSLIVKQSNLK